MENKMKTVRMTGKTPTHQIRACEIDDSGIYSLEYRRHGADVWIEERRTPGAHGYISLPRRLRVIDPGAYLGAK